MKFALLWVTALLLLGCGSSTDAPKQRGLATPVPQAPDSEFANKRHGKGSDFVVKPGATGQ